MSNWGCPNEVNGICKLLNDAKCDPGMKGCTLYGKYAFADPKKNSPRIQRILEKEKHDQDQPKKKFDK